MSEGSSSFARINKVEGIGVKFYFFCGRDVIKQFLVKKIIHFTFLILNKITYEMNSCLRAVRWTHVRRQFLNLDKMQQSMSEGSSLDSCQKAVSQLRQNATKHV